YRILVLTAKSRGVVEQRSIPWTSLLPDGEESGPTVDPARFEGQDGAYPGHWRQFPDAWDSPEQSALGGEMRSVLAEVLDELPAGQRAVISLRDVDGHSAEEVCELLRITPANQRVLLHRARAVARARLADYLTAAPADGSRAP